MGYCGKVEDDTAVNSFLTEHAPKQVIMEKHENQLSASSLICSLWNFPIPSSAIHIAFND